MSTRWCNFILNFCKFNKKKFLKLTSLKNYLIGLIELSKINFFVAFIFCINFVNKTTRLL